MLLVYSQILIESLFYQLKHGKTALDWCHTHFGQLFWGNGIKYMISIEKWSAIFFLSVISPVQMF